MLHCPGDCRVRKTSGHCKKRCHARLRGEALERAAAQYDRRCKEAANIEVSDSDDGEGDEEAEIFHILCYDGVHEGYQCDGLGCKNAGRSIHGFRYSDRANNIDLCSSCAGLPKNKAMASTCAMALLPAVESSDDEEWTE